MSDGENQLKTGLHYRELTVANIREPSPTGSLEVIFLESARLYQLLRTNPAFEIISDRLRDALNQRRVLKVGFASQESDVIEDVDLR